jgi:hypothetical protein
MKPFLLFGGYSYESSGYEGWSSFKSAHGSLDESMNEAQSRTRKWRGQYGWFQVVDLETLTIVKIGHVEDRDEIEWRSHD